MKNYTRDEIAAMDFTTHPQIQAYPAMQFYGKEWLTGTGTMAMTPAQRGAFADLLAHAWFQTPPCSLPNDDQKLAVYARFVREWKKSGKLVRDQFVICSDGRIRNPKQVNVWLHMISVSEGRKRPPKQKKGVVTAKSDVCSDKSPEMSPPSSSSSGVGVSTDRTEMLLTASQEILFSNTGATPHEAIGAILRVVAPNLAPPGKSDVDRWLREIHPHLICLVTVILEIQLQLQDARHWKYLETSIRNYNFDALSCEQRREYVSWSLDPKTIARRAAMLTEAM